MCTLKNIVFTKEGLESYYVSNFHGDLRDYFDVSIEDGVEVININKESGSGCLLRRGYITPVCATAQGAFQEQHENDVKPATLEEQFYFVTLVSFVYSTESLLERLTSDSDEKKLVVCMNELDFPWIKNIKNTYELNGFLKVSKIGEYIVRKEEVKALIDAMRIVEPFMLGKLEQHLRSWNDGYFGKKYDLHRFLDAISKQIKSGLYELFRKYYEYQGLMGILFSKKLFASYFEESFFQQMKEYFQVTTQPGQCPIVLEVYSRPDSHWEDGNPGNTVHENFMFSGMLLYLIITEQGIIKINKEASEDFHLASGWSLISSGPGAGPYLHPLRFIEYAGLLPRKSETSLYLEMLDNLFPFMQQEISERLNGKGCMKDSEAGVRFYNATRGQVKKIKRYIEEQEKQIKMLLELWSTSQARDINTLLKEQNIPTMIGY